MPCRIIGNIKGVQGEQGPQGAPGQPGPQGAPGQPGPAGKDGIDGTTDTPSQVLSKIKNVDGQGSGLDSDLLDGHDSTYFATKDDLPELLSVEHTQAHTKFQIYKSGNVVVMIVEPWTVNKDTTEAYVSTGLSVPAGYAPAFQVYIANVLPNDVRMRVNTDGAIEFRRTEGAVGQFCGTGVWIVPGE